MPINEGKQLRPGQAHADDEQLERFMRGQLSRPEAAVIVRHLLSQCPQCVAVTRKTWRLGDPPPGLEALIREMQAQATARDLSIHDKPGLI